MGAWAAGGGRDHSKFSDSTPAELCCVLGTHCSSDMDTGARLMKDEGKSGVPQPQGLAGRAGVI